MITAGSVITATIRISPWHQSTGSTIATGASAASLACRRRAPRVRLAYQPIVALHHLAGLGDVGDQAGQELERVHGGGAGGGPSALSERSVTCSTSAS